MAAHTRWAEAMNDRQWGWRVAMTHHASREPLPASLRDPHIRRAYRYLQGTSDDQMAMAHALKASPDTQYRMALQRQQLMREQDAQTKKPEAQA
jgi:hypothetical protein